MCSSFRNEHKVNLFSYFRSRNVNPQPELMKAAKELNTAKFQTIMEKMKIEKPIMYQFLNEIGTKHWALSCGERMMYGIFTNNNSESFNNMIKKYRDLHPLHILHGLSFLIDSLIVKGREKINKEENRTDFNDGIQSDYPKCIILKIQNNIILSRTEKATLLSNNYQYYVSSNDFTTRIVDIHDFTCSCQFTEQYGYPCSHICGVLILRNQNPLNYVSRFYLLDSIKLSYNGYVNLVDLSILDIETSNIAAIEKQRAGRKRKMKRIRSKGEIARSKNSKKCSRCHRPGHYKTRCTNI